MALEDLTSRLTDDEKWERGRFVEFMCPQRGFRIGRVMRAFTRGKRKDMVVIALHNPHTGKYGNRGGYRHFSVIVEREQVVRFYGKQRRSRKGDAD